MEWLQGHSSLQAVDLILPSSRVRKKRGRKKKKKRMSARCSNGWEWVVCIDSLDKKSVASRRNVQNVRPSTSDSVRRAAIRYRKTRREYAQSEQREGPLFLTAGGSRGGKGYFNGCGTGQRQSRNYSWILSLFSLPCIGMAELLPVAASASAAMLKSLCLPPCWRTKEHPTLKQETETILFWMRGNDGDDISYYSSME